MILIINLIFVSFFGFSADKSAELKQKYLKNLYNDCYSTLSKKMAIDKSRAVCLCVNKKLKQKMNARQLHHLIVVNQNKRNQSTLPVDEGPIVEDYDAMVSAECLKMPPPVPVPPGKKK